MKHFHSKLDKLYEGLHLKKTYIPETEKPDFKSVDNPYTLNFLLHKVYTMIELTLKAGRNEDFSDKEKLDDYERLFKDVLHTIESSYKGSPRATFTPDRTNIGDKERFHQQMAQQQAQEESFFLPRNSEEELENQKKMEDALIGIFDKMENVLYNQIVRQKDRIKQLGGDIQKLRIDPIIDGAENIMRRMLGLPEIPENDTPREERKQ